MDITSFSELRKLEIFVRKLLLEFDEIKSWDHAFCELLILTSIHVIDRIFFLLF